MIEFILLAYALVSGTWLFYLAVMHLKKIRDIEGLTTPQKVVGLPFLWIGIVFDVLLNWLVCTVLLLELPREFLTTARFRRWHKDETWRGRQVRWWCKHFLEPFDVGHCG